MRPHDDADRRRRQLAAIHAAKAKLGMDDDTYRAMLHQVARVNSAAMLTEADRQRVIRHLGTLGDVGWKPIDTRSGLRRKIERQLEALDRPAAYGDALAKRICKVEKLIWCDISQLRKVVAALAYQQRREARQDAAT